MFTLFGIKAKTRNPPRNMIKAMKYKAAEGSRE
jgi:hypothetical protein